MILIMNDEIIEEGVTLSNPREGWNKGTRFINSNARIRTPRKGKPKMKH